MASVPEAETAEISLRPRFIVTPTLVAMNIAYFLAMISLGVSPSTPSAPEVLPFGANFGGVTVDGEWWRLLSSTFIHYGVLHLTLNMWGLWNLGILGERLFGSARFLLIYVLSGLGGSAASLIWHPHVVSAGASGALFGLAGALAAFLYLARIHLPRGAVRRLLVILVVCIGLSLGLGVVIEGIDNAGHLGGLVVGAILGASLPFRRVLPLSAAAILAALVASAPFATRIAQNDPKVKVTEAVILRASGDEAGALAMLETAMEGDVADAETYRMLTFLYLEAGRYDAATQAARRWVELDQQNERAHYILGASLHQAGEHEAAVDELEFAIELEPDNLQAHAELSRALRALDRHDDAVAALEEAMKWDPDSAFLHSEMGLARLERGELELAVAALEKAVELDPGEAESYNRLSLVLARAGQHEEALAAVKKAMELRPDAAHILDSLGTVRFYRDELDEAVDAYRDAIELDPDAGVYRYNLSLALRQRGDVDAADAARDEALGLDPELEPPPDGTPIM